MSSSVKNKAVGSRRLALVFSSLLPTALLLSACGFQPVHVTKSSLSSDSPIRAGVTILASAGGLAPASSTSKSTDIDNSTSSSMSRQFTHNLEDMLGSPPNPPYKLEVAITQSSIGLGVSRDGTASRYNLILTSNYRLVRISDNKEVDNGTIRSVTSYNNPNNQYFSTYISEQDARKRGISELAELYRQRLMSFMEKTCPSQPPISTPPPIDENCPKVS